MKSKTYFLFILIFCLTIFSSFAQRTVTGRVTDENMDPLPGAVIQIKGTTNGTITDIDGKYTIQIDSSEVTLVFMFVNFKPEEVHVSFQAVIDVTLRENTLSEVVVTGLAITRTHSSLSYSTSEIKSKKVRSSRRKKKIADSQKAYDSRNNTEEYATKDENDFMSVGQNPLSTFSIDVDRASYSNVRRFINQGSLPPKDAVRVEEMINYFSYEYAEPKDEHPFGITTEYAACPWNEKHNLLLVGLQAKKIQKENLPNSNITFLIDVSGSMGDENKLPLVKSALQELTKELREKDRVAIVVYAGAAGLVLPSTSGNEKDKIIAALDRLQAGGSTAGGKGIELAYKIAQENFIENGNNRVILCTDGDFNVGASSDGDMKRLIEEKRKSNIFLTCLGFGMGNYKDAKLETLADKGNGNYGYIDNFQEARRMLVTEFSGTLFTLAKDVKIQIEFNPSEAQAYRLVGYENRLLNEEDFDDDTKDAGEIGVGHSVTAIYEIIPTGVKSKFSPKKSELKYQKSSPNQNSETNELATIKFRYKEPKKITSIKFEQVISNQVSVTLLPNLAWASSVAMVGMLLTDSKYKQESSFTKAEELAKMAKQQSPDKDEEGYKGEFIRLIRTAESLAK